MTNPNVRPDLEALKVLLSKVTPAWCGAMVSAFGIRARRAQRPQDVREGMRYRATAEQLATAMPEIASLIAHIERLQNALKPFAAMAEKFDAQPDGPVMMQIDFAHFRNARATLSQVSLSPQPKPRGFQDA